MQYSLLGKSNLKVSRLCFGALTIGPLQANLSLSQGAAILRYALQRGINFIDTAETYGTYPYIREALKGHPNEVVIASKSYAYTYAGMKQSVDRARLALDRDQIEVFLLHEQETALTLHGHRAALDFLLDAKLKGKPTGII